MKKIGVFGGTFNPIHNMHIKIAEAARDSLGLDQIIFVPSANPPHKSENIETFMHRFKMVELAIEGLPQFSVSNIENKISHKKSYTAETLKALKVIYPFDEIYFIMGSDCIDDIEQWYHPEEVFKNCIVALFNRPGFYMKDLDMQIKYLVEKYNAQIISMGNVSENMSSTNIRAAIQNKDYKSSGIPKKVIEYIVAYRLYR